MKKTMKKTEKCAKGGGVQNKALRGNPFAAKPAEEKEEKGCTCKMKCGGKAKK